MIIAIREVAFGSEEYRQLLMLRYEILRKPLGLVLTAQDVATDDKEFHIAAFNNQDAIGCVLLRPLSATTIKLRQMAVSDSCQGHGVGAKLVRYAEELAASRGFTTMQMHARKFAEGFYEKLGYIPHGDAFVEVTVPTIKMLKPL